MAFRFGYYGNLFGGYSNQNFLCLLNKYIGQTVTIFTVSGGPSGCGFTGILLSVNRYFIRLSTFPAAPPANPLNQNICNRSYENYSENAASDNNYSQFCNNPMKYVGSVCDIPIYQIVSFCHNSL